MLLGDMRAWNSDLDVRHERSEVAEPWSPQAQMLMHRGLFEFMPFVRR